jgi:ABC-type branched-subunit amino acid transport system substrate-binding protein
MPAHFLLEPIVESAMKKKFQKAMFLILLIFGTHSYSEESIVLAGIAEASGGGAIAGVSFRNGYRLAIEEINNSGGLAGKRISLKGTSINE